MDVRLASVWKFGRILFLFNVKSFSDIGRCSVSMNNLAPKTKDLSMKTTSQSKPDYVMSLRKYLY
jgi:hypothetical protein